MKCPHCGQEHPDNFQFCPVTGQRISSMHACRNEDCRIFGQYILPPEAIYCPECGRPLNHYKSMVVTETIGDGTDRIQVSLISSDGRLLYKHNALVSKDDMIVTSEALFICSNPGFPDYMEKKWIKVDSKGETTETRYDDIPENDELYDTHYSWQSSRRNKLFLKRNPSIRETVYIGKIKGKSVFIALNQSQRYSTQVPGYIDLFTINDSIPGAKVYDEDFNLLLTVGKRYVPKWALNSGYFSIVDTETGKYGLCDMQQNIIIPCQYKSPVYEDYDDIIYVPDGEYDERGRQPCFCVVNKQWYSTNYQRYLLKRISENIFELINPKTSHVICKLEESWICDWGGPLKAKEVDGFSFLPYLGGHLLCNGDNVINLDGSEEYEESCYTRSESSPTYEQDDDHLNLFISEGRIITYAQTCDSVQDLLYIRIRDYSGKIIKEFDSSITFKRPYKNGKAVFVKTLSNCRKIGYVDMDGGIHYCPLSLPLEDRYNKEIKLSDVDCEIVSDDTIWVRNSYDDYLIRTNGTIIMEEYYSIDVFDFNLLKVSYFNGYNKIEMICDGHGNPIYNSQSSNWEIKLLESK